NNFAATMTLPDAIDFQEAIGGAAKEARLRHLRNLWAEELRDMQGLEILTPADPRLSCGITSFRFSDRRSMADNEAVARELLERLKIFTVARDGLANGACVRVTPALFNSSDDIARLTSALRTMSKAA
ncbi:MAG: aminotransferase, partial [Sphingorhabdus sp.]|nr:aminotransferase [Sphingorhabdus sp.]